MGVALHALYYPTGISLTPREEGDGGCRGPHHVRTVAFLARVPSSLQQKAGGIVPRFIFLTWQRTQLSSGVTFQTCS